MISGPEEAGNSTSPVGDIIITFLGHERRRRWCSSSSSSSRSSRSREGHDELTLSLTMDTRVVPG